MGKVRSELPFTVDKNLKTSLVNQVADGFRQAISVGQYKPGDVLPPVWKIAEELGVSLRVPRYAIARLVAEGWLATRQRIGSVVLARNESVWRGRVLFIVYDYNETSFYFSTVQSEFRKRIEGAGYQFSCVTVSTRQGGRLDCTSLDVVLRQSFDFAVTRIDKPAVARRLEKAGVPFAVFDEACLSQGRSVGWIRLDLSKAVPELVERCREAGVRKVLQVSFQREGLNAIPALRQAGIEADLMLVRPTRGYFKLEAVERGTMDALLSRLDDGRNWLPDLLLFADDFVAFGALTALLARGVRIPEDVRCVTFANRGFGPVFPVSLARLESDPVEDGERIAQAAQMYLADGKFPDGIILGPTYCSGRSFPC